MLQIALMLQECRHDVHKQAPNMQAISSCHGNLAFGRVQQPTNS